VAFVYINTDNIADLPKGDHAMVVSTLNGSRVVVEHVLSQRTGRKFLYRDYKWGSFRTCVIKMENPEWLGKGCSQRTQHFEHNVS
jgi:hypothetical protein